MSFLAVKDLHINLGEFYLNGVSFDLDRGDYLTIIGPTGAGKTILLESLIGFWTPDRGTICLEESDITRELPERRRIGIVYQDYALLPHFTVYKNIEYGLKKKNPRGMKERIHEIATALYIDHLLHRKPATLSGGEQQRVALARALIVEPKMLLMDEPFSALDPQTRRDTRSLLKKVITERNTTVMHVTHDLNDAWTLANKVAVIRDGHLLQFGPLEEVFTRPRTPFIADFVGATLMEGIVIDRDNGISIVKVNGLSMKTIDPAEIGATVKLAVRPEDIIVGTQPAPQTSAQNHIRATLSKISYEGKTSLLSLSAGETSFDVLVTNHSLERLRLTPGDTVYAMIKSTNVRIVRPAAETPMRKR
ncbi:MAG: ATP-binding cassette domain-containing protein [Deltaproteobacteria bacterium]|nr:ATP-binding cassette domain-containing protein [Deltaproteobacteria bacterium]